jgi:hypothetical protein
MLTAAQRITFATGVFIGLALGLPAGAVLVGTAAADPLPVCAYEDGNTDGQPCAWTDPDTGRAYFVDSANYR